MTALFSLSDKNINKNICKRRNWDKKCKKILLSENWILTRYKDFLTWRELVLGWVENTGLPY